MKKYSKQASLLIVLTLLLSVCTAGAVGAIENTSAQKSLITVASAAQSEDDALPRLEDDFYDNINAEWLTETELPGDSARINAFFEIQEDIDAKLRADMDALRDSDETHPDPIMQSFAEYYRLVSNYEARNAAGFEQIIPRLERIEAIESLEELDSQFVELTLDCYPTLFSFYVGSGTEDSSMNVLSVYPASPFLGSRSYYEEAKELGDYLLEILKQYTFAMFELAGYSEEDAAKHWDNQMALDAMIVPLTYTNVEASDPSVTYNPVEFAEFVKSSKNADYEAIVTGLCGKTPDMIEVYNPKFMDAIDDIYNEENLELLKSSLFINEITSWDSYLTEEVRQLAGSVNMLISGTTEVKAADKAAYEIATGAFGEAIGQYYGLEYLGEEERDKVVVMIEQIIAVYRERLLENDWLEDETIEMAVRKLDAMKINVGWPEKLPEYYSQYEITSWEDGGNLIDNVVAMSRIDTLDLYSQLGEAVDKELWGLPANEVNAFYGPSTNSIYIPAAILNAPFYSADQSDSANLGGIGVVIGHEITHAFDASGSLFDENGNMNNWWTAADKTEFDKRTQAMIELFDGLDYMGVKVNGDLTKTENVADAGGLSCALQITKDLADGDIEDFFESYAKIWRAKETQENASQQYLTDTHSPPKLRVNVQLGNCDEFYSVYGVEESDEMYLPEEERVSIW